MYRGRKIEPIRFPVGLQKQSDSYKIEIIQKGINPNSPWDVPEMKTVFMLKSPEGENITSNYLSDFPTGEEIDYYKAVLIEPKDIEEKIEGTKRYPTFSFRDVFNYRSPSYIEYSSALDEKDLLNFYLSIEDEDNDKYLNSFVLNKDLDSRDLFLNVNDLKKSSRVRKELDVEKTKTFLLKHNAEQYSITERERFPFAVDINFNFKDVDDITKKLNKLDLHPSMIDFINTGNKQLINLKITDKDFDNPVGSIDSSVEALDFYDFLSQPYYRKYDNFISLPDTKDKSIFSSNLQKVRSFSEFRRFYFSMEEIINRQETGSELLYLKIEKFIGKNDFGEPFQTIYLSGDSEVYKYFDTQVKNKKFYTYKITGIFLLHGVKYRFEQNNDGTMSCITTPIKKIINHHFLSKTIFVLQPLQHPPNVHVYKHESKDKVFFYLRLNSENTKYKPFLPIIEADNQFVQILNTTKQYSNPEHSFLVEDAKFEVFKSTFEPKRLKDMEQSFLLSTRQIRDRTDHLFIDRLENEKDYYYLFRTINGEGFPGNPTNLYKIRLERGPEENKLKVEIMDFKKEPEEYDIKKNFNQLMHIYPNQSQTIMTNLGSIPGDSFVNTLETINVGLEEVPKVWGKKFKFRVTSNNTGKKIDFNVKFLIKRKNLEIE